MRHGRGGADGILVPTRVPAHIFQIGIATPLRSSFSFRLAEWKSTSGRRR